MLKNYFKIALRNLRKHKGYSFINIFGLAVGLACCLLILLFIRDELRYDRFHEHAEQTYRIVKQERELASSVTQAVPLAPVLARDYPEVLYATRVFRYWFTPLVSREDAGFYEERFFFADTSFFDVFSFRFVRGDATTALAEPFSVLLTRSMARKYFGDKDPVGQTLMLNAAFPFTVTGVLEDVPRTSHFTFDFLASIESIPEVIEWPDVMENWGLGAFPTYVVLPEGYDPARLEAKLVDFSARQFGEDGGFRYTLQPLTAIHLYSKHRGEIEANSDVRYVYLLAGIALIILLLACINYTNLATARFAQRAREVGIRKAVGAHRRQLMLQFMGESLLLSLLAMLAALAMLELLMPVFDALVGGALAFNLIEDAGLLAALVGIALVAGLTAGSYPAFYLSAFRPGAVLKGAVEGPRRAPLRKVLVVTQYALAVVLLVGTAMVYRQIDYMSTKKLGFEKEHVVVLPVRDEQVKQRPEAAKAAFLNLPEVTHASSSTSLPGTEMPGTSDFRAAGAPREEPFTMFMSWIDFAFMETMGMEMAAGRAFSDQYATEEAEAILLNETAVRTLGWAAPDEAVGQPAELWGQTHRIVGVVKDFHFDSLREPIKPLLFFPEVDESSGLILRLRTDDLAASMTRLEATWKQLSAAQPFTYSFLDQDLERLYVAEQRWGRVIAAASLLALLIACLGLFGLASFTAEQRTKEIGVRKVLGASAVSIAVLLSSDFARLVGIAFVVAAPLAYFVAHRWLQNFAYRVDLSWEIFAVAGLAALLMALAAVSYQAVKAALADPVKSLRYE